MRFRSSINLIELTIGRVSSRIQRYHRVPVKRTPVSAHTRLSVAGPLLLISPRTIVTDRAPSPCIQRVVISQIPIVEQIVVVYAYIIPTIIKRTSNVARLGNLRRTRRIYVSVGLKLDFEYVIVIGSLRMRYAIFIDGGEMTARWWGPMDRRASGSSGTDPGVGTHARKLACFRPPPGVFLIGIGYSYRPSSVIS